MNSMKSNVSVFLTMAAFCLATWACSGEDSTSLSPAPEIPEQPIDPDALCTITPRSVAIAPVEASQTPLTRSATGEPVQEVTYAENLAHNTSVEATLEAMPQEAQTRAVALGSNVKYRVVVYDNAGAIVNNLVYTGNSTTPDGGESLQLKVGTYRLFAYSFNTNSARDLNADGTVDVLNTGDFMTYTDPNFTVTAADLTKVKSLDINFIRQFAKLILTIKAEHYNVNTITAAQATLSNVFGNTQWTWNGVSNSDASNLNTTAGNVNLVKAVANGASVDCGVNTWTPCIYVPPISNQTITATSASATIDGAKKTLSNFRFPKTVTLVKGQSYRLTITFGNYYVLTNTNPVVINSQKWAKTNLQQSGSGSNAPVSFVTNPWDAGSKWKWGMRDAQAGDAFSNNESWDDTTGDHQDPCRALGNRWRLPTQDDCTYLINNSKAQSGTKVKINGVVKTVNDNSWTGNEAVFIKNGIVLCLPKTANQDGAYYWTSTHIVTGGPSPIIPTAYCLSVGGVYNIKLVGWTRSSNLPLRCVTE